MDRTSNALKIAKTVLYPELFYPGRILSAVKGADDKALYVGIGVFTLFCFSTGLSIKSKNGKFVLSVPSWVYDLTQKILMVPNTLEGWLCYLQPSNSVWNERDVNVKVKPSGESLDQIKNDLTEKTERSYKEEDLVLLYDSLPVVDAETDLIAKSFRGKIVRCNTSVLDLADWFIIKPLTLLGFGWGKRYKTQNTGDPLFFRWLNTFYFPIPLWGNVCMVNIQWRGKPTATMSYDHQPWKDYFRKLPKDKNGNQTYLGVWTHKHIAGGWFLLTEDKDVPM